MPLVTSGVEHGNLRELALARMKDLGTECRDVRTREVGIQEIHHKVKPYEVSIRLLFCLYPRRHIVRQTNNSWDFLCEFIDEISPHYLISNTVITCYRPS